MAESFDVVIDNVIADTKKKMLAVLKNSIKETVEKAQRTNKDGGKMRVDTGFLRSSGQAKLNSIPVGKTEGRKRVKGETGVLPEYSISDKADYILPVLAKMKIGDTFYFGWTARYAIYRETYDGFMESAVMDWRHTVDNQVRRLKK